VNVRAVSLNGHVPGTLKDQLELSYLSRLQDQRAVMKHIQEQQRIGMEAIAAHGANGVVGSSEAPDRSEVEADDMGIVNRSPTTNNHYYVAPSFPDPAPVPTKSPFWPWLLAIPLVLGLGGLAWYLWPKATGTSQTPPPDWAGNTTIILRDLP
jgi:hypothetical protein